MQTTGALAALAAVPRGIEQGNTMRVRNQFGKIEPLAKGNPQHTNVCQVELA